jgi:hypothetical protein
MRSRGKEVPLAYFSWRIRQKGGEAAQEPASSSITPAASTTAKEEGEDDRAILLRHWQKTYMVQDRDGGLFPTQAGRLTKQAGREEQENHRGAAVVIVTHRQRRKTIAIPPCI